MRGRYSIIGLEPDLIFRASGRRAEINRNPQDDPQDFAPLKDAPLAALRALIEESRIALPDALPPMAAGVFGYLGYDMVRLMEDSLSAPAADPIGIPDAMLVRPTLGDRLRCGRGHDHHRHAGTAAQGGHRENGTRARA